MRMSIETYAFIIRHDEQPQQKITGAANPSKERILDKFDLKRVNW